MSDHFTERDDTAATRTAGGDADDAREDLLPQGTLVDRYVLLEAIGRGGMGVVYVAIDPDLERRVAIKLLRPSRDSEARRGRMLREAQALARLAHPNVIAIHDTGRFRGFVFIAMEYVKGRTLKVWLTESTRRLDEILAVFLQAGRGLIAAHEAELVHRDFKPANVMVGDDERVRVLDFGLARAAGVEDPEQEPGSEPPSPLSQTVTVAGSAVGTPAYMAPEQQRGQTSARADQYSYCAALHEAVYGRRHAVGQPIDATAEVPGWLAALLARGLSVEPEARFGSMREVTAEIERRTAGAGRAGWIAAAVIGAVIAAGAVGLALWSGQEGGDPCGGGDAVMAEVWGPEERQSLERAFGDSARPHAGATLLRTWDLLDAYAGRWKRARVDVCRATNVHRTQSEALLDQRMSCLEDRRRDFRALVTVLAGAADDDLDHATSAVNALDPVTLCVTRPMHDDERAAPPELVGELSRVKALYHVARYGEAAAQAQAVHEQARAAGASRMVGRSLLWRGLAEAGNGDASAAEASLLAAFEAATAVADTRTQTQALIELVQVIGAEQGRHAAGLALAELAERHARAARTEPDVVAEVLANRGGVLWEQGKYDEALTEFEEALRLIESAVDEDDLRLAPYLDNLGISYWQLGREAEALALYQRAIALLDAGLGARHPDSASARVNYANVLYSAGDVTAARANFETALEVYTATYPATHPYVATLHNNLGVLALDAGDPAAALEHCQKALAIAEATQEDTDPRLAFKHHCLGRALAGLGRHADAAAAFTRAIDLREGRELNPSLLADSRFRLAQALWDGAIDRRRAVRLGRQARNFEPQNDSERELRATIDAWLSSR